MSRVLCGFKVVVFFLSFFCRACSYLLYLSPFSTHSLPFCLTFINYYIMSCCALSFCFVTVFVGCCEVVRLLSLLRPFVLLSLSVPCVRFFLRVHCEEKRKKRFVVLILCSSCGFFVPVEKYLSSLHSSEVPSPCPCLRILVFMALCCRHVSRFCVPRARSRVPVFLPAHDAISQEATQSTAT